MKRPLVAVVSCYAAGLMLAEMFQPPLAALFAISFFILVLTLVLEKFRLILICLLLVFAGWTNLICHTAIISPNDLRATFGDKDAIVSVRGTLIETPKIKISGQDGEQTERSLAQVHVTEIRLGENWSPAPGNIVVTTPGALPDNFFAGQPVEISGVISRPPPPLAEGLFDDRSYLQTRGIFYQLKTESTNDWQLRAPILPNPPVTDRFLKWSKHTLAIGLPVEDEPLRLLWAMTLGWRTAFTGDIGDPFLRAGTMHMFAIDGLRIALISGMLVAILRVLRVSRAWCGIVAIPVIWFYTAATGWESSAIRASVMMTIVLGGWALKRPGDLLNSLAAAAFIILIGEPRQLFEASFQLSFSVMVVIGLMLPRMNRFTDGLFSHDPLVPDDLIPKWRRIFISTSRILSRYFSLSIAAWLGSIPLSALYFHLFSPVSPFSNLVAVPLGTLALMSNLGALICGSWFPWATELFNHSAWFFMVAMTDVSEWSTRIPGSYFYVPAPSWALVGFYYLALVVVFSGWLKTARRKIFGVVILILISVFYFLQWESSRSEIKLTVLPLNGGHAIFVDAAGTKDDWLIDCGNENAVNFTLKNFLRAQGVNKIHRLVLTEGDSKNIGGTELLDQLFGVGGLWTSDVKFRSPVYRRIVTEFEKSSRRNTFNRGDRVGGWQILWPPATNNFPRSDDNALVLLGNINSSKILLLSDLGRAGQSELLSLTNDLRADIVIAGLPDEGEPLSDALIEAIKPKVIVIMDSEFPARRRAGRELKRRLETKGVFTIYTRTSGAVTIITQQDRWELHAMDGESFQTRTTKEN